MSKRRASKLITPEVGYFEAPVALLIDRDVGEVIRERLSEHQDLVNSYKRATVALPERFAEPVTR